MACARKNSGRNLQYGHWTRNKKYVGCKTYSMVLHTIPVSWKCGTSILVVSLEHIGRTVVDQLDVFGQTVGLDCLGKSMEPKKIVEVLIIIEKRTNAFRESWEERINRYWGHLQHDKWWADWAFLIEFWPNKRGGNDNRYCLRLFNKPLTLQDLKANSTKQITKPLVGWS